MTTALPSTPSAATRISLSPTGPGSVSVARQRHDGPEEVVATGDEAKVSDLANIDSHLGPLSLLSEELLASTSSPLRSMDGDTGCIDPRFVLPKCELPPRNELEPVELFVANAVKEQHQQQDSQIVKNYRGILEAFRFKKDLPMLRKLMISLRTSGSTLNLLTSDSTKHARLIHQVVRFLPFAPNTVTNATMVRCPDEAERLPESCDVSLADAQFHLILALISANSVFLVPAMTALWKMLTFQVADSHPERSRRIHAALASIMRLCPKAKTELLPIISANGPFRMRPESELIWYYKQCLYVVQYLPPIRGQILELIIDRCLEVDVEIKITDVGEVTIDPTDDSDDIFQLDLDDDEGETKKPEPSKDVTVDEMADKLDSLMLILFEHAEQALDVGIPASELYQVLARVFESAILITHKSKFVQFLILHVCGTETKAIASINKDALDNGEPVEEPVLYREFASTLIDVILDPYRATVTRQCGACYLASFVSRASFVCVGTVYESVNALLRWAEAYIQSLGSSSVHAPDAREQCSMHSLFYTVCQSAYYIMCFRGAEAVRYLQGSPEKDEEDLLAHIDLGAARWTKICAHPLLPLRYCLESVRSEFLRISKMFSLIEDDVLNRLITDELRISGVGRQRKKKSVSIITTAATLEKERLRGGVGGLGRGTNPLDSFFPFDPYLLRRSHGFVEPFYKHWDGGASENEISDDDGDYDEEDTANVVDGSDDEVGSQRNPVGGDSDSDSDDETPTNVRKRLMSFASNATSVSSRPGSLEDRGMSADVVATRVELKKAWSKTVKRARAPSSENGSW